MKYYYDIYLNFNDYPINYYDWDNNDSIERVLKIPVIKVLCVKDFILYKMHIESDISKFIVADGVNALALEVINSEVVYLSTMAYDDENSINELVRNMEVTDLKVIKGDKRALPFELRKEALIKKILLQRIRECDEEEIKYIHYEITLKDSNKIEAIRKFLIDDINNNFNEKYVNLYEKIYK